MQNRTRFLPAEAPDFRPELSPNKAWECFLPLFVLVLLLSFERGNQKQPCHQTVPLESNHTIQSKPASDTYQAPSSKSFIILPPLFPLEGLRIVPLVAANNLLLIPTLNLLIGKTHSFSCHCCPLSNACFPLGYLTVLNLQLTLSTHSFIQLN